jgi:hypothetical protein
MAALAEETRLLCTLLGLVWKHTRLRVARGCRPPDRSAHRRHLRVCAGLGVTHADRYLEPTRSRPGQCAKIADDAI